MITRYSDQIDIIDTLALGQQNVVAAYLIQGKESALIDMGYTSSFESLTYALRDVKLDYLLPTHVHLDHSGSCGTLAEKFVDVKVRVHPLGERHLIDPSKLWEGAQELFGEKLMKRYGKPRPIGKSRVSAISDDEVIRLGKGLALRAIWTPGHASHHLSYLVEETGDIFTGDAVGITYPDFPHLIPTTPPTSFDLESAVHSLERIKAVSPHNLLTPHFGVVHNAEPTIEANVDALRSWVRIIRELLNSGESLTSATNRLTKEFAKEAGFTLRAMPGYARLSIKISVLGVSRYLSHQHKLT